MASKFGWTGTRWWLPIIKWKSRRLRLIGALTWDMFDWWGGGEVVWSWQNTLSLCRRSTRKSRCSAAIGEQRGADDATRYTNANPGGAAIMDVLTGVIIGFFLWFV